jgi:hypothetical protein
MGYYVVTRYTVVQLLDSPGCKNNDANLHLTEVSRLTVCLSPCLLSHLSILGEVFGFSVSRSVYSRPLVLRRHYLAAGNGAASNSLWPHEEKINKIKC